MPDLPEQLAKLREKVEQEKCPECGGDHIPCLVPGQVWTCPHCHGTGLNPDYDALLEVVVEKQEMRGGTTYWYPRSWEGKLDGELEGALIKAVIRIRDDTPSMAESDVWKEQWERWNDVLEKLIGLMWKPVDTREAAVAAVREAVG